VEKVSEVAWATRRAFEATRAAYMFVTKEELDRRTNDLGPEITLPKALTNAEIVVRGIVLSRVPATVRVDAPPPDKGLASVRIPAAVRLAEADLRLAMLTRDGACYEGVLEHLYEAAEFAWPISLDDFADPTNAPLEEISLQSDWLLQGVSPSSSEGSAA
jgi:hypothetical protein